MAGEIPPRFTDLPVSKLSEGPPARYQLLTKKESLDGRDEADSRLRRWTVGERDPTKPNKTILLVGETGAGKSTMINAMVNYVMGVEWEDKVWYEIIVEGEHQQTMSQTAGVTVYEIFGFEKVKVRYSLTIIDTPGFGATDQNNCDILISVTLHDLFLCNKVIKEIDIVGLVLKASENRLSDRLKYILDSVVSLFGKDLEKSIVALLTHSDGMSTTNALQAFKDAKVKCAKTKNDQPVHFMFNNCQQLEMTPENQEACEFLWKTTKQGMDAFFCFLDKASRRELNTTLNVLIDRARLIACIGNLHDRIELIEMKQTEIRQTQDALKKQKPIMQTKQKMVDETDCEVYTNEIRENESIMRVMTIEMTGLEADKARWVEEAYQHVTKLQEMSLNSFSRSTYIYLDFLIEKMREKGDMEKVQRLEDIRKRCEEGRKDGNCYMAHRWESLVEKVKALPSFLAYLMSSKVK